MPTYTREELLAIREKMKSSQSQQQSEKPKPEGPANARQQPDLDALVGPIRSLWKKAKDIQKHIDVFYATAEQRKLMNGGQDERALKVFRAARISLAKFHIQLHQKIYAMTLLGLPSKHAQAQMLNSKPSMEMIDILKQQVEHHTKQMKKLKKLLEDQMKVLEKRFVKIDLAIKQLNKEYKNGEPKHHTK
ncbi:hypothetical protein AWZ03_006105 [Drosophila navojoa]|uniref:Uncharacterized protein n=1 Tax=Drosophila navojoa TaxID=7232 RepID=A0A484BFG8_DRONA|nr:hypothetical protein AWZ03_006105 [Drosophila navojoa]